MIDTTLAWNNQLCFRKSLLKLIIKINGKIRDEKLKYHIDKKATKIILLPSGKVNKYENLEGGDIRYSRLFYVCHKKAWWNSDWYAPVRIYVNKIENRVTFKINPIQDGWMGGAQKSPPLPVTSFPPVTSTKVRISPQNFLTFSFNPFDRLL